MSDQKNSKLEHQKDLHLEENQRAFEKTKETPSSLEYSEVADFAGTIETPHEKVSEIKEQEKSTGSSGMQTKTGKKRDLSEAEKRKKLISEKQPRAQIEHEIHRYLKSEIKKVQKEANQYQNNAQKAFEFNESWRKIKELYQLMQSLARMTYETLKKLWLKLIHGISI